MNQSLKKTNQIFELLRKKETPIGVKDFARALDMPKSTVSRFLSTMETLGFVRRDRDTGKFCLGLRLYELGCKAIEDMGLRDVALPQMVELRDKINENVFLTVLDGTRITYLDKIESQQAIMIQTNIGGTAPAYCVSSGKAMIAHAPDRIEEAIAQGLKRFTPTTLVDPHKLRAECRKARRQGYALNKGEFREDVYGVGAPIFHARGAVLGAVSTATPASRMNKKAWNLQIEAVLHAARAISHILGASNPPDTAAR